MGKLYALCATSASTFIDVAVCIFVLASVFLGAKKGFINCFFKVISGVVALTVAISFAKPFVDATNGLFGIKEKLPDATQKLGSVLISGFILFVGVKIAFFFIRKIFTKLVEKMKLAKGVNSLLGAVFGLARALVLVCAILAVLEISNVKGVYDYIGDTVLVKWLFENNPLVSVLKKLL